MDRQEGDLSVDPRRLRNDDLKHRRGGYGRPIASPEKPLPDLFN